MVIGQLSRSHEEIVPRMVGATSSKCFLSHDAVASAVYAVVCVSALLSVRPCITSRYWSKMALKLGSRKQSRAQ